MSVAELLIDLRQSGVRLEADGDRLRYFPRSALTPDLLGRLKARKADVVALLHFIPIRKAADAWSAALDALEGDPDFPPDVLESLRSGEARWSGPEVATPCDLPEPAEWDWFDHITPGDLAYLAAPRDWPSPCPWCGGRLRHSTECRELAASWSITLGFGKHKGQPLESVPLDYLRWLRANCPSIDADVRREIDRVLGIRT
jgi:hypothetical protein